MKKTLLWICLSGINILSYAQSFVPGNLVVTRYGNGTDAYPTTSNEAVAVFLDEYTREGTFVRTIAFPTDANGATQPYRFTGNSTAATEALLTLSANRQYLVAVGYNVASGASISSSNSRTIAVVTSDGAINTTTITNGNIGATRSAIISDDKANIWVAGAANAALRYMPFGSTANGYTNLITTPTSSRSLAIYGGQLYISGTSLLGTVTGGSPAGLPTSGTPTITNLPGFAPASANIGQFVLFDGNGDGTLDIVYYTDETNPGNILKYVFDGTNWNAKGSVNTTTPATTQGIRSITGHMVGNTAILYAVTTTLGTSSLIKMTDANALTTTINATDNAPEKLVDAPANTRFRAVAFAPGTTDASLPVELKSFKGSKMNGGVLLNWVTQSENNNAGFEIMRSGDGTTFEKIGYVTGKGNSATEITYSYRDTNPLSGVNYYRLLQKDYDGKTTPSQYVAVDFGLKSDDFNVYKTGDGFEISFHSAEAGKAKVKLTNMIGNLVYDEDLQLNKGINKFKLGNNYPSGTYIATLSVNSGVASKKIIK